MAAHCSDLLTNLNFISDSIFCYMLTKVQLQGYLEKKAEEIKDVFTISALEKLGKIKEYIDVEMREGQVSSSISFHSTSCQDEIVFPR